MLCLKPVRTMRKGGRAEMGNKVTYWLTLKPIQSQNSLVLDLQTDTAVEAKIFDLLDRDSPRSNTRALATTSANDIPRYTDGMCSWRQVRHVKVKAMRGKRALNNLEASISACSKAA